MSSHKPAEMRHSSNTCKLIQESPPAPRREAFSLFMALQSGSQTSSCPLPSSSTSWWHPNPVPPTPPWCLDPRTRCPAARSNVLCLSAHPHPTGGTDPASSPAPGAGCATSFLGHWLPSPPAPCTFWAHAASSGPQHPQLDVFSIALSLCAELSTPCQCRSRAEHEAQDSPHLEYPWGRQDGAGQGRMLHPAACVALVHVLPVPHLSCWLSSSAQGEELGDIQLSPPACPVHQQAAWGETWHIPQADGKETSSSRAIRTPNRLRHFYSAFHPQGSPLGSEEGKTPALCWRSRGRMHCPQICWAGGTSPSLLHCPSTALHPCALFAAPMPALSPPAAGAPAATPQLPGCNR